MKVALIQQEYKGSKKETIKYTKKMIQEASKNGAKLVVLQELHQNEYFCQSEDVKFFDYALSFKEDIKYFSKIAKKYKVVLITSLFEKRTAGLYHNTSVVFEKDGTIAGKYRKMHIPDDPQFYEKFYFTQGDEDGFKPIDTSVGKLGVMICWDQWYPEGARIMTLKGAEILIYPTAIGWFDEDSQDEKDRQLDSWITIQRSHAIANGVAVISCNRVGFESDSSGVTDGIRFWGNSFVSDAGGKIIAQAKTSEKILYAKIDSNLTKETRDIWPFLRDRRIECYKDLNQRFCDQSRSIIK